MSYFRRAMAPVVITSMNRIPPSHWSFMSKNNLVTSNEARYFNRDLSWLKFNERVLEESLDPLLPVYEKIKFIAIHASNLDEFYRVRVAQLETLQKTGEINEEEQMPYSEILSLVRKEAAQQTRYLRKILAGTVVPQLEENGIVLYQHEDQIIAKHLDFIHEYFNTHVLSFIQPVWLNVTTAPFLEDRQLYFICQASLKEVRDELMLVNIPSQSLPRFIVLPALGKTHYIIYLDDIVRLGIRHFLKTYKVKGIWSIKLNRNADLGLDEEHGEIANQMRLRLRQRAFGDPSRFQHDNEMPKSVVNICEQYFKLEKEEITATGRYQQMADFFSFPNPVVGMPMLAKWKPLKKKGLGAHPTYFDALDEKDYILHFPYQSYDHVLIFFNQVVLDPFVTEIRATFYRVASNSHIVNALISASKNGKKVTAFVEVKARFDEANNLLWAEKMTAVGIQIHYSLPDIKVHAKTAMITRIKDGVRKTYGYYGTGNFNEKTSGIYSDIGLLTANSEMNEELKQVFNYLYNQVQPGDLRHLLVSPFYMIDRFKEMIRSEMEQVKSGNKGHIIIKLNNLEDQEMIEALYDASNAGVKIDLIVRSVCRLRPGVAGMSENIRVLRVVGRHLEHCRVFIFHNGGESKVYLGSADWMQRNLRSRVEVVFPVYNEEAKKEILQFIKIQLSPYEKTAKLNKNLESVRFTEKQSKGYDAQEAFYDYLAKNR